MTPALKSWLGACLLLAGCSGESGPGVSIEHAASLVRDQTTICILGDPGTGSKAQFAVARVVAEAGCDQLRVLGDLVYPSGIVSPEDPLLERNFVAPFRDLLGKMPFYLVLGNHDHRGSIDAWRELAARYPEIHYPYYYYFERWQDICFVSLDTTFYEKLYYLDERSPQTNWLHRTLESARQRDPCGFSVVFAHHPYRSSGHHGNAQPLLDLFLASEIIGKVDLYVAGHDHNLADEGSIDGTRLLVSGSAGSKSSHFDPLPGNAFGACNYGFIAMRFERRSDETPFAMIEFYTVDIEHEVPQVRVAWRSKVTGAGIRE